MADDSWGEDEDGAEGEKLNVGEYYDEEDEDDGVDAAFTQMVE